MPYIKKFSRDCYEERLEPLLDLVSRDGSPAMLNYLISKLCRAYLGDNASYETLNDAVGVLECAKIELYRRMIAPYEDRKIAENGDL